MSASPVARGGEGWVSLSQTRASLTIRFGGSGSPGWASRLMDLPSSLGTDRLAGLVGGNLDYCLDSLRRSTVFSGVGLGFARCRPGLRGCSPRVRVSAAGGGGGTAGPEA